MRTYTIIGLFFVAVTAFTISPVSQGQFQFGGGRTQQWGGGGKFGSKGGGPGGFASMDPNALFDRYASGRPFFMISETKSLRDGLTQYAQEKGITNGQITRDQFLDYAKTKLNAGGGGMKFGGPGATPMPGSPGSPGAPQMTTEIIHQMADSEFKRRDRNDDGKLNADEMPDGLRNNLVKWDTNKDNLIDQSEFRAYVAARIQGNEQDASKQQPGITTVIIEEEDWDRRPNVLRAGHLPKEGLPSWFRDLDKDEDGQVALYEWRKGGKPLDDFGEWDANDDGFITPEEALKHNAILSQNGGKNAIGGSLASRWGFGGGGKSGKGGFGSGKGGFTGFGGGGNSRMPSFGSGNSRAPGFGSGSGDASPRMPGFGSGKKDGSGGGLNWLSGFGKKKSG
jgi:hypothetical protein